MKPHQSMAMLLTITIVVLLASTVPAASTQNEPDYCTNCHPLGGGIAIDELVRYQNDDGAWRVMYEVRGAPAPGAWAVFDPSGSKMMYGDTATGNPGRFILPMDGQTYNAFWVTSWDGNRELASMVCAGRHFTTPTPPATSSTTTTTASTTTTTTTITTTTTTTNPPPGTTTTTTSPGTTTTTTSPGTTTTTTSPGTTTTTTASPPPAFTDVPQGHPYADQINDMAARHVVDGYGGGLFGPEDWVRRQQFAKMVVLAMGYLVSEADVCPFGDVDVGGASTFYPDNYVAVAAAQGITLGVNPSTFAPWNDITRAQLITMVARAGGAAEPPAGYSPPFGNFSTTHYPWARRAAYAGLLTGLQGMGPGYDFWAPATRGEVCAVLYNLLH